MTEQQQEPGRFHKILTEDGVPSAEPDKAPSLWAQSRFIVRRRIIAGILFLVPIATTIWFLSFVIELIYGNLRAPISVVLVDYWRLDPTRFWYKIIALSMSIVTVLVVLYLIGLFVSRTAVRRLIDLAERLVTKIPIVKFCYRTTKKIADALSPSKGLLKRVVMVDFYRPNMKRLGFATGETFDQNGKLYVNVFVPISPNVTSGHLILMLPEEVWETDIPVEEAVAFIVSGGILPVTGLQLRPYQPRPPAAPDSNDHKPAKSRVTNTK
jgi:uncharacterized membrane protein